MTLPRSLNIFSSPEPCFDVWGMWEKQSYFAYEMHWLMLVEKHVESSSFRRHFIQGPKDATRFCPLVLFPLCWPWFRIHLAALASASHHYHP